MQRCITALILLCSLFCIPEGAKAADPDAVDRTENNKAFALDLYHQLHGKEGNLFLSPYSISSAFAMCYAGARGNTKQEMATVLHFPAEKDRLHEDFFARNQRLKRIQTKGDVELNVANSLWAQYDYRFLPEYVSITKTYYDARIENVDFKRDIEKARQRINTWTEEKTNHLIENILPKAVLSPLTKLVLVSAVYFKGEWLDVFENRNTKDEPFWVTPHQSKNVPLMSQEGSFEYAEDETTQVLLLPYKGQELSMVILLPKAKDGIEELERHLTTEKIHQWIADAQKQETVVYLPKFTIEASYGLKEYLTAMGMHDAFTWPGANFSGMDGTEWLYISEALHKAWVKVDEKGTEAAAATAVVMTLGAVQREPPKTFRADHPFVFFIRDNTSGSILFMGRLSDPTRK